jgi:RNA polymerase sigma-70 factor (ECF subfamily)
VADSRNNLEKQADLDAWVLATAADAVTYAASLLRDRAAAEDVVQDCYCRLLRRAGNYDLPRDGRKLLFAAVTNACFNHNSRRRPSLSLNAGGTEGQRLEQTLADPATAAADQALLQRELEEMIDEALARLPLPQRAAVELKSMEYSLGEIGEVLKVSPGHAAVLIHRGRLALAKYLAPYLQEQPR